MLSPSLLSSTSTSGETTQGEVPPALGVSLHMFRAQPCRLPALFLVSKSERWRLVTHHVVWGNYTSRRSHEAKSYTQVSKGACCYPIILSIYR